MFMKKFLISLALVLVVIMSFSVFAFADEMKLKGIDTILSEIRQEQGISSTDKINVDKVSPAKLEELGDSVMEAMIGNTQMHDQMDINLGGDGSASLTAFHEKLGFNYLSGYPIGMMNLMTGGMMNRYQGGMMGSFYRGNMMNYFGWGGLIMGFLLANSLIVIIILIVIILKRPRK